MQPQGLGLGRVAGRRPSSAPTLVAMKDETTPRRRCTACRRWYRPAASAVQHQKTCSAGCRCRRRRSLARKRRDADIHEYRVEERERQRACRAAKGSRAAPPPEPSRAGLPPQVTELEEVLRGKWDRLARLSRAGLRREIRQVLGRPVRVSGPEVGQVPAVP
jgi:hypothetical protein